MKAEIGRLAFRVEGQFWNAYWTPQQDNMSGALLLASIRMTVVEDETLKNQFMELAKAGFGTIVRDVSGQTLRWNDPKPAPKHERSGNG